MASLIPVEPSAPFQTFGIELAGEVFRLDLRWNSRDSAWYLSIFDDVDDPIVVGVRCVLGTYLGERSVDPRFPKGSLFMVDTSGEDVEAGLDDFGGEGARVQLWFASSVELAANGLGTSDITDDGSSSQDLVVRLGGGLGDGEIYWDGPH